jgi:hypothetical protein
MNVAQKQLSSNAGKSFAANALIPGKEYSFDGTPMEGSSPSLVGNKRKFYADFVGRAGGDLKFKFNGMDLFIDPSEVALFKYEGYNAHAGKRRRNTRKNRKQNRKNTRRN